MAREQIEVAASRSDPNSEGRAAHSGDVGAGVIDLDRSQTGGEVCELFDAGQRPCGQEPHPDTAAICVGKLELPGRSQQAGQVLQCFGLPHLLNGEDVWCLIGDDGGKLAQFRGIRPGRVRSSVGAWPKQVLEIPGPDPHRHPRSIPHPADNEELDPSPRRPSTSTLVIGVVVRGRELWPRRSETTADTHRPHSAD